jgi:NAD(P)-dependent dehydrogenase (short-subunit alcohol dehydrogenase family)
MHAEFDFTGDVVLVTGATGTLGSSVCRTFTDAGATVVGVDVVQPSSESAQLEPGVVDFRVADLTNEERVADVVEHVVDDHGGLDALLNIAGTWRGGTPIHRTDEGDFDLLFDVNLKTMFLASKHAIPHLREATERARGDQMGAIVSVSARSSLEGGEGDGPYRASKAGVRLLTETIARENVGQVRANAVMPSVIDTPMNRDMMPDADHDAWVDPRDIAETLCYLCSDAASVTSGAAVPVYGEA